MVDKPYKMAVHQITSMIIWACKEETKRKNRRGEKRRKEVNEKAKTSSSSWTNKHMEMDNHMCIHVDVCMYVCM